MEIYLSQATLNLKGLFWALWVQIWNAKSNSFLWRQGYVAQLWSHLPPLMWPGVEHQTHHMWVKFVVSPCPCSRRFISTTSFLPHLKKPTLWNSNSNQERKEWLGGCVTTKLFSIPTILSGSNKKIMYFEPNFFYLCSLQVQNLLLFGRW